MNELVMDVAAGQTTFRLLLAAAVLGVLAFAFAACSHTESRPAIIPLSTRDIRDSHGRFIVPHHPVTGEPAATMRMIYYTPSGATLEGPEFTVHSLPALK